MKLEVLKGLFAVCKLADAAGLKTDEPFMFFSRTDEEISLVCYEERTPKNCIRCERGWKGFRICGELDFLLTGVLAAISAVLAAEKIGIFAVSTYNTDYVWVKEADFDRAAEALRRAGHLFV